MISWFGSHFLGDLCSLWINEFVSMKSNLELVLLGCIQYSQGHHFREVALLTEYIAELRQVLFGDFRNHLLANQINVLFLWFLKLRRKGVSTQECRDDFNLLTVFDLQSLDHFQEKHFGFEVEAITWLHLKSGGALSDESFDISLVDFEELLESSFSASLNRGKDSATSLRNIFVALINAHTEFVSAVFRREDMGVRVD